MFTFDDASATIYNNAYPVLDAYRGRGTFYVESSLVGTDSYVTWEQLQTMDADGWSIGNHSDDSDVLTGLSQADVTTKVSTCRDALIANSLSGAALHHAYPGGGYDATVIAGIQDAGCLTGRTIDGGFIQMSGGLNLFTLNMRQHIDGSQTMEALKNWVDDALRDKKITLFLIHNLPAGSFDATDFEELVDYIATRYIPMLTINDLYDLMSGPVNIPYGP